MLVSDYILNFLSSKKIKKVFLITGGAISFVVDAFSRTKKIDYICCAHEQAAAMMADAYSRLGPNLGVTMVTSGPGATNLLIGIACSWFDSIPTMHICGQVNKNELSGAVKSTKFVRQVGFQETDIVSMVKPITKFAYQIKSIKEIPYIFNKAYHIATTGRPGPVLIDLPMNFQRQKIEAQKYGKKIFFSQSNQFKDLKNKIKLLLKHLYKSNRPVIILGGGVKYSKSKFLISKFLKTFNLPYVTTWSGFDTIDHGEKNYIGTIGVYGNRAANFTVQNSDFVLNIGSRLDTRITGGKPETFARKAKIVSVDIDKNEINKKRGLNNFIKINYDVKDFLSLIIKEKKYNCNLEWLTLCKEWKVKYPRVLKSWRKQKHYVNPYHFIDQLSDKLKKNDVIVADDGAHLTWAVQSFKIKFGQEFFSAYGNSPMGYAFPAAIGASIALNKKRIICIDGDGSIQMNIQEFQTMIHNKLPIKIFILNNSGYGIIKQFQDLYLSKRYEASGKGVTNPDFKKISKAYGINYCRIENHNEIAKKLDKVLKSNTSEFIDVIINPNQKIEPKLQFGNPIEDLSPLLNRNEFKKNMLIGSIRKKNKLIEIN
jgi:acetolactate synthase-1/2/3 large subunit